MDVKSVNNNGNIAFQSRWKSLNVVNPISYYANRYFNKMAKNSMNSLEPTLLPLSGKINVQRINKGKVSEISAWDINPANSEDYVLFLHGMSQNVSNYQRLYNTISERKVGVFAVEYRGYGENKPSSISEDKLRRDVETAYEFLTKKKNIRPENITVIGHSMGGALATNFASKHNDIRSLVLICPITSMSYVGKKFSQNTRLGMAIPENLRKFTEKVNPLNWLYNLKFSSLNKIDKVKVPTYIIQSQNDTVTLLGGARKLAKKAKRKGVLKEFALMPSGGHKVDIKKINKISDILCRIYSTN